MAERGDHRGQWTDRDSSHWTDRDRDYWTGERNAPYGRRASTTRSGPRGYQRTDERIARTYATASEIRASMRATSRII